MKVLLLNANWMPLHFITDLRAIKLCIKGKAEIVDLGDHRSVWQGATFNTSTRSFEVPATIRLIDQVRFVWKPMRFRKAVLFERDMYECQYCGQSLRREQATIDHVLPKSRGGGTSWENCATACKKCNKKKADMTPSEAGMRLSRRPKAPKFKVWTIGVWHEDWASFVKRD